MTSHAWRPIDPVAPSSTTRRRVVISRCSRSKGDEPQIAIYDRSHEHEAVEPVEQPAVAGDQRARLLDPRLALDRRLDEVTRLRGHPDECPHPGAGHGSDADQ